MEYVPQKKYTPSMEVDAAGYVLSGSEVGESFQNGGASNQPGPLFNQLVLFPEQFFQDGFSGSGGLSSREMAFMEMDHAVEGVVSGVDSEPLVLRESNPGFGDEPFPSGLSRADEALWGPFPVSEGKDDGFIDGLFV